MKKWILKFAAVLLLSGSFAFGQTGGGGTGTGGGGVRVTGTPAANDCAKFVNSNTITTAGAACGTGAGGVTSVGFTGGLISVGTPTTTPAFTVAGTSGGIPYFSSASTWASSALLASGGLVLGGGAGTTPATSTQLTFSAPTLTVGLAGTSSGILALTGLTSGSATLTAPAIAGTSTNPILSSNNINLPAGTAANPSVNFVGATNAGLYNGSNGVTLSHNGADRLAVSDNAATIGTGSIFQWGIGAGDTGLSRDAAGVVDVGTGAAASKAGFIRSGMTVRVASNFTTSGVGTALEAITGLSWTLPNTGTLTFSFACDLAYKINNGAVAVAFGIQASSAPTNIFATGLQQITGGPPSTVVGQTLATLTTTTATNIVSGTPGGAGSNNTVHLAGTIENPATTANTITILTSTATAADTVTVLRGSECYFTP